MLCKYIHDKSRSPLYDATGDHEASDPNSSKEICKLLTETVSGYKMGGALSSSQFQTRAQDEVPSHPGPGR